MRKKRRTAKQIAATRKMIRANRKAKRSSKRRRRNPIAASGAAERKRPKRHKGRKSAKRSSGRRKSPKRSAAARKAARTRASNKAKRRAAARKGARRRKAGYRRAGPYKSEKARRDDPAQMYSERKRPRRKKAKRRSRRKNPIAAATERKRPRRRRARRVTRRRRRKNPIASVAEAPRRKRRRKAKRRVRKGSKIRRANGRFKRSHGRKRHYVKSHARKGGKRVRRHLRNPLISGNHIANPIEGPMQFLAGFIGVGTGYALASLADRLVTTHALNAAGQDAPAQGEIYNSEALAAPLWGNIKNVGWKRIVANVVAVIVPLGAASAVRKHLGLKTFFQLAAAGAFAKGAGKVMDDGIAHLMTQQPLGQRLYASEIAATGKLNASSLAVLPAAPPATFAGLPQGTSRNGITTQHPRTFSPVPQGPPSPVTRHVAGAEQERPFPALDVPFNPMAFNPDGHT